MARPLVMIGIDAASPDLLERWIGDGTLPHLGRLVSAGTVMPTAGIDGFYVGSTWPSMYTGTSPAKHGIHYLVQIVPGTYELQRVADAEFVRRPAFWSAASRAGRRVAILDVPLTRLEPGLNGVQTVEWGGHDALYGFQATPDDFARDLIDRHGTHPLGPSCDRSRRSPDDYADFVTTLEHGIRKKASWTREVLADADWDLFMTVFTESHCAGHQCWHLHDTSHPAHDPAFVTRHGDPLHRVYRAIDSAIGSLIDGAPGAHVLVFTAHGMAHRFGAQFLLRDILVRFGVTAPPDDASRRRRTRTDELRALVPEFVKRPLRRVRRALSGRVRRPSAGARPPALRDEFTRSACFPVGNGLAVGGIRLNLAGREPAGIVAPGREADEFCARLQDALLSIADMRTERPLVRRMLRTKELYAGEYLDALPDLLVEWDDAIPLDSSAFGDAGRGLLRAHSPATGIIEGANEYARTGEHRPDGWLVAAGPGIAPGRLPRVSLLDLAPTVAAMLGVELPDIDGRPIPSLVAARRAAPFTSGNRRD